MVTVQEVGAGNLEGKKKFSIKTQQTLAKYALDEIERIIQTFGRVNNARPRDGLQPSRR